MEAQEAACEIVFHWLTALRRLASWSPSSSHTARKHARHFADGLPKALRTLAVFQPQEEEEAEGALNETIRCVPVLLFCPNVCECVYVGVYVSTQCARFVHPEPLPFFCLRSTR